MSRARGLWKGSGSIVVNEIYQFRPLEKRETFHIRLETVMCTAEVRSERQSHGRDAHAFVWSRGGRGHNMVAWQRAATALLT